MNKSSHFNRFDHSIVVIEFTSVKLNGELIVEYQYNENGQVSEIKDVRNGVSKYFTYDFKGKLIKVVNSENNIISYNYDNLDNVQKTSYKLGDIEKSFDFEYDYETNEYTKEGYFNRIEKEFCDEVVKGGMGAKGTYGAKPVLKTVDQVYDEDLKMKVYQFSDNYDFIWYNLETFNINRTNGYSNGRAFNLDSWKGRFFYNKTFYMWLKPSGAIEEENLFRFQKRDVNNERKNVAILNILGNGRIGYKDESKNYYSKITTNPLKFNEWNLVGVKIFKKENENNCKAVLFINDEFTDAFDIATKVNEISDVVISSQTPNTTSTTASKKNNVSVALPLQLKVCMMSFGAFDYTKEDIKTIYLEGLKYLVNSASVQKATGVSYYNADVFKDFDVITLNGSLESTKGNKPVKLMQTDSSFKVEKARIFKYDSTVQRHVYGAFDDVSNFTHGNKSLLAYNLNLKDRGVISFKFKVDEEKTTKRYILSSYKENTEKLAVLIDNSNNYENIYFEVNGQRLLCKVQLKYDHWYNIMLFFRNNEFKVFVDGNPVHEENISLDLSNAITYIGSKIDGTSALNGYVEMFAYSNKEVTGVIQKHMLADNIYKYGNVISVRNKLDSLGRVSQKVIKTNKTEYTTTYSYDKLRVNREAEPDTHNIKYTYDSMGNITQKQFMIKDIVESTSTYKYDKLGRLIEEVYPNGDIETFTYDTNGNIITHQLKSSQGQLIDDEKYHYSSTNKDQLISITDGFTNNSIIKEYKYEGSYKGNPTEIITNGISQTLTWEGRKLKQVGDISFTYNEEGIRVEKLGTNFVENYSFDGSKVIGLKRSHESGSYEMYFNYDEQGELIGLSSEGKEYFYIRDITGNITKIIDEDGKCVVQYTYDAWGNFKKTIYVDCTASHCNPFVYKGYFFDSEIGWYYLKSRYYDPKIRRFISADSFSYLDSESLTGINLYSYCGNSPVLGYDPEGTWSWKKFWGVVAVVAVAAVAIAAVVTSVGAASAAVAPLAFMYLGVSASTTYAVTVTVATVVCTGIAAFAIADSQEIITDGEQNYLSFLGDAYDPIKTSLYSIAYLFPMTGQYAQPGWGKQINSESQAPKNGYGPKYGAWIQKTDEGINRTIYGGDGRQICRFDCGEHFSKIAKEFQKPHTHHFGWYYGKDGKWHFKDEVY